MKVGIRMHSPILAIAAVGATWLAFTAPAPAAPPAAPKVPVVSTTTATVSSLTSRLGVFTPGSRVQAALEALSRHVVEQSHPAALRTALKAYYNYATAHPEDVRKPYFYFVDYGLDNRTPRGYVFDMQNLELVDGPFIVAHGRGSARGKDGVPVRFSNQPGSATTSLGLYRADETYDFSGKSAGRRYSSIGLRLSGLSDRFNSRARDRGVVVHGAPYVTPSGAGRSEGCPAMEQARARRLIPKIANGGLVFLFSPQDDSWMQQDPWVNASEG
jgi:hypothetical protein